MLGDRESGVDTGWLLICFSFFLKLVTFRNFVAKNSGVAKMA